MLKTISVESEMYKNKTPWRIRFLKGPENCAEVK